jgi:adenosyl cobinamide kinase/adenosyl cobinamide phosphate guanylyltransferase
VTVELILSLYASIIATYFLYTRVEHQVRHWRYAKWIEKERTTPLPESLQTAIERMGVTLPYEVDDQVTEVMDSDEREWEAEQMFKRKKGR